MSYKKLTESVVTDAYQSSTNTVVSSITDVSQLDNIAYQIDIQSGTASGTYTIEASNTWDAIKGTGSFVATTVTVAQTSGSFSGSKPSALIKIGSFDLPYPFVRLSYTNTSGDGYYSATASSKGI